MLAQGRSGSLALLRAITYVTFPQSVASWRSSGSRCPSSLVIPKSLPDGSQILLVGADNFPFPIPLKKNDGGQWFFDTAAGKDEILNRRIGRNELAIIEVCGAVADAEAEYFS